MRRRNSLGGWTRLAALAAALAGVGPVGAQEQWARFDGGVETSPGVTFGFERPSAVFGSSGETIDPGQPRFGPETLLCALPETESLLLGLSVNAIAAGDSGDGRPVYVVNTSTYQRLSIHIGEGSVERALLEGDWTTSYRFIYKDPNKNNRPNLLVGQHGYNNSTADSPTRAFALTNGGTVYNGLIVLACDIWELEGSEWKSRRAGLAYTTVSRLGFWDPWIVVAVGVPTNEADTERGSPWSFSSFPVGPDELVAVWTDYRSVIKTGGIAYATRFVRSEGEWTAETIRVARSESPLVKEHWHCGGLLHHPDGRESILVSTGDGTADNQMLARTKSAGGAWAAPDPIADTGVDARSQVYMPSADWTEPVTVWGGQGSNPYRRHNQAIAMIAANPECTELLCGTDETSAVVLGLTYDPDTLIPTWRTTYLPAVTSWPGDGALNFSMHGRPGGPYLGRIDAASAADWQAQQRETRVLYSPDGEHWGQCMVAETSGSRQAVLEGLTGYIGSIASEPAGFRRISVPEARLVRPLAISPSTDNWLFPFMHTPTDRLDYGVTITKLFDGVSDLPPGVPAPPCDPRNMFLIDNQSYYGRLGVWHPVSDLTDVPVAQGSMLLRAWVYALTPQYSSNPHTTAQLATRFYDETGDHMDLWTGRMDFDAGAWTPLTVWSPFKPLGSSTTRPELKWLPAVYLRAEKETDRRAPFRLLIAWEGVYPDAPTVQGHGLPPQQTGSTEHATLDGFDLGEEWTVLAVGMLPEDEWDNRVGGSIDGGIRTASPRLPQLFALERADGSASVRVLADPPLEGMRLRFEDGSDVRELRHARNIYWLRGSPVMCLVRARAGEITLDYSVGGSEPRQLLVPGSISPQRVRLGPDAMWWHSVEALPYALPDDEVDGVFHTMSLRCRADFNDDGLVDTRDVVTFLNAWSQQLPEADFNGDGRIDSTDIIAFLSAFAGGC